jgi:sugar lactone lactonase YvrE
LHKKNGERDLYGRFFFLSHPTMNVADELDQQFAVRRQRRCSPWRRARLGRPRFVALLGRHQGPQNFPAGCGRRSEALGTPFRIASLAPRRKGGFVAGTDRGFALVDLDANQFEPFEHPEQDRLTNRFNDGKLDREGRFWAGTMDDTEQAGDGRLVSPRSGSFLAAEPTMAIKSPTALPFSRSGRRMYHNDSGRQITYMFDLDEAGAPSNRRVFAQFGEGDGYPDGMTVDADDCLWIAFWDGWCVRRFSPDGECIAKLDLPVQKPTSCAFGGPGSVQCTSRRQASG